MFYENHIRYLYILVPKPKGEAPTFVSELLPAKATEGEKLKLVFKITGTPAPAVEWFKDGEPLKDGRRVISSFNRGVGTLELINVALDDQGKYKCVVTNHFGSVEASTDVTIDKKFVRPEATEKMEDSTAEEGEETRFDVPFTGYPTPEVEWFHGPKRLDNDDKHKVLKSEDQVFSLVVKDLEKDDAGMYKCVASNDAGKATARAELKVKEKLFVPEFQEQIENKIVKENEELEAICTVKAKPKAEVTWYKDGKRLYDTRKILLTSRGDTHSLYITKASTDDMGSYMCEAKNKLGGSISSFDIIVEGKSLLREL